MRTARVTILFGVVILLVHMSALAQTSEQLALDNYPRTSWTEFDGFSLAGVRSITQDPDGYVWFAADAGLIRFDGARFVRWETIGGAMPETVISDVHTTRNGNVWIGYGNSGGVSRIDEGGIRSFTWRDGLLPGVVRTVHEDAEAVLWVGTSFGLARLRRGRWERLGDAHGLPSGPVGELFEDRDNNLWVTFNEGIFRRTKLTPEDKFEYMATVSGRATALAQDNSGVIWIADATDVRQFNAQEVSAASGRGVIARHAVDSHHAVSSISAVALLRDRRGHLWIATQQGLLCIQNEKWNSPPVRLSVQNGLPSDRILSLFEDVEGNIWVGTTAGLARFSMTNPKQVISRPAFGTDVNVVTLDQAHAVWVGTRNGLIRSLGGRLTHFGRTEGLPGEVVSALHVNQHGTLWVATERGVARFVGNKFVPIPQSNDSLNRVSAMTTDSEGTLWMCDFTGIWTWKDGVLKTLQAEHSRPSSIHTDQRGRVWVGFVTAGVLSYDGNTVTSYTPHDGLPDAIVTGIHEDVVGAIWITTSKGLARVKDGHLASFTMKNGLPDDGIMAFAADEGGYLWLGTRIGLIRVHPAQFERAAVDPYHHITYTVLNESDGFESVRWAGGPNSVRDAHGSLWFVSRNGISMIEPGRLREVSPPTPVRIERVVLDGAASSALNGMQLQPTVNRIQVDFTSLTFVAPSKLQFRYRLEGLDRDWIAGGPGRQAFYTNLRPGRYSFTIATRSLGGEWTMPTSWNFVVLPPFYRTPWFYVTSLVAAALIGSAIWHQRTQQIRRRYALVFAERARISREIHDTLLQGMVGVALQLQGAALALGERANSVRQRIEQARDSLETYTREARRSIWELRSPLLETHELPTALRRMAEALVEGTGVGCEVAVEGRFKRGTAIVEQHLLRISHEAISNALRHAGPTVIRVRLRYDDDDIDLRVEDNGCGFDPSDHVRGRFRNVGLVLMRERAEQIRATLRLTSGQAGTVVEVNVSRRVR